MDERTGDWIETYTGRKFWPLDPRPEEIVIEDIGHALAMKCRYSGHCLRFYSVAQHSVLVSRLVPAEDALWGLLHDAGEAYLSDVPRPVKPHLPGFQAMEDRVLFAVALRFDLGWPMPRSVQVADTSLLLRERQLLMPDTGNDWGISGVPAEVYFMSWPPETAKAMFFARLREILEANKSAIAAL